MKQFVKIIPVDVYKRGVCVFFGTREQLKMFLKKEDIQIEDDLDGFLGKSDAIILRTLTDALIFSERKITEGTLIHEISHAAKHILRCCDVEDEEAECHLLEYLCNEILPWARATSFLV